jgi:myo-inositol-1(or 4)-monophosphatase
VHEFERERQVALDACLAGGEVIANAFGRPQSTQHKGSIDLVTETDRNSEAVIVDTLRSTFPEDSVLAEEGGAQAGDPARRWIIDPLDGTTNFAHGYPMCCVSIALEVDGRIVVGTIHDPIRGETFWAVRDGGAWLGDQRLQISRQTDLTRALLITGFAYDRQTNPDNNLAEFAAFVRRAQGVRRDGSAALNLAYTAAGRFDGFWEQGLQPWDVAAGALLIEEAGGRVTDYEGRPHRLDSRSIAAGGPLLEVLREVILQVREGLSP